MTSYKILQKRQENGLWGTPMNCVVIDKLAPFDKRKELLQSAAIALYDQKYNCRFKIVNSKNESFTFLPYDSTQGPSSSFFYEKYEVVDNNFYIFEDEKEHLIFLRKQKLKQLENIF